MRKALDVTISLLGLLFIFLIVGKLGFTGAVTGVSSLPDILYFPIVLIVGISLVMLMNFRRWALGSLAALTVAGAVVGKVADKHNKTVALKEQDRHNQVVNSLDDIRNEILDANLYARGGSTIPKYGVKTPLKGDPELAANMYLEAMTRLSSINAASPEEEKLKKDYLEEAQSGLRKVLKLGKMKTPPVTDYTAVGP